MSYPATIDSFNNPQASDQRPGHAQLHRDINAVVIALQAKLGIDGSLDNTSIDFLLKSDEDPGHTHTPSTVGLGNVTNALQLVAANNLSDLTDVSLALINLGIAYASAGIASQADAEAGLDNTKMMTPLRTKQEIAAFATPIASDAEASGSLVTTKAINPKQLHDNIKDSIGTNLGKSFGVNYQAATSGFVVAYGNIGSDQTMSMSGYVGASNPASTKIAGTGGSGNSGIGTGSIMFPVMKDQWYRVDFSSPGFSPGTGVMNFIPNI